MMPHDWDHGCRARGGDGRHMFGVRAETHPSSFSFNPLDAVSWKIFPTAAQSDKKSYSLKRLNI